MPITASQLRQDVYRILDEVLETGTPIEISRHGRVIRLVPDVTTLKLDRLIRRDVVVGDPKDLAEMDWSGEWQP